MMRVLVIEMSLTFRHALVRRLEAAGAIVSAVATYEEGLTSLRDAEESFSAVVLGWPEQAASISDELIALLDEDAYRHLAVVVLCQAGEGGQLSWITERPGTALLTWDDHAEIGAVLKGVWRRVAAPAPEAATPREVGDTRGIRILLVDDSPTSRVTYGKMLKGHGYTVETAADVDSGFEQAAAGAFDIAIIDYFMPGETGDVLCRRLRRDSRTRDVTVSILTGTYLDHVIADSLAAGAVECMFKNEANELFLARIAAMSRAVRSRRSVERERRQLEGILSSVGDGVYGVDRSGRIAFMNPTARQILGYTATDRVVGEDPARLIHPPEASAGPEERSPAFLLAAYASGERIVDWQTTFRGAHEQSVPVEGTVYPLEVEGVRQGSVVAFRNVAERKRLEEQLRWQASHDPLTNLLNRRFFDAELEREVRRAARTGQTSGLIYIDLDQFKYINDTAGHAAGDRLLIEVAERLRRRMRAADTLARLGGDEFAVLLHGVGPDDLYAAAEAYRELLARERFSHGGRSYAVTASIGAAIIDRHSRSAGAVMSNADLAANVAKEQGRNQTHRFEPSDGARRMMKRELGWSERLKRALEGDSFELALQPIVPVDVDPGLLDAAGGGWGGIYASLGAAAEWQYEVLLRLRNGPESWVLPGAFMPAAERFSMMPAIDRWVVERAVRTLAACPAPPPRLAINLSSESLAEDRFGPWVRELLASHGVDGRLISFEITESSGIMRVDAVRRLMQELQAQGVRFALDDFGSGFCSFGQLKTLNVDYIKIDGQFVQQIAEDALDRQVVLAITRIAHAVGMKTVAEFVDRPQLLPILRECEVDFVQGNAIAPAMPAVAELAQAGDRAQLGHADGA